MSGVTGCDVSLGDTGWELDWADFSTDSWACDFPGVGGLEPCVDDLSGDTGRELDMGDFSGVGGRDLGVGVPLDGASSPSLVSSGPSTSSMVARFFSFFLRSFDSSLS